MPSSRFSMLGVSCLLAAAALGLGGCSGSRQIWAGPRPERYQGVAPMLITSSPSLVQPMVEADAAAGLPWYATRRDVQPSVLAGVRSPQNELATTYTYDRQSFHSGRVTNHFYETTIRTRQIQTSQ